jgi:hypothetical protein
MIRKRSFPLPPLGVVFASFGLVLIIVSFAPFATRSNAFLGVLAVNLLLHGRAPPRLQFLAGGLRY